MRFAIYTVGSLVLAVSLSSAQPTNAPQPIDLPTALRLAGAQNLDVQIASEKLREAQAIHQSALAQFFPWIAPGITYRQHDDKIQDVSGNLIDVHKYSYAPGVALAAQVELGDAIYQSLASKQLAHAAGHALEAQRQQSVLAAAQGYFELALAQGAAAVARESVRIATSYEEQVSRAVTAGIAFKGDALRARVQKERNELALRQTLEQQRIAAARDRKSGATYGPLIPSLGAQAFFGGLGGGREGIADTFGGQQDYMVGASWRIGPGGLFDFPRIRATDARLKISELGDQKLKDELTRQVVEGFTRWQSQADQIQTARQALAAAAEGFRLAEQRKEFAVGIVLETIQAETDLTHAQLDYLKAVAAFNQAQYALQRAIGGL